MGVALAQGRLVTPANVAALVAMLKRHEGVRLKPYVDTKGKLTIGCGRNLTDRGITAAESDILLLTDIAIVRAELDQRCAWWSLLDDVRQLVLADMAFNLGVPKMLTFKKFLAAVMVRDFETAAHEMHDSQWCVDVGARAVELIAMMRTGRVA